MTVRLAIATCAEFPDLFPAEQPLVEQLRSAGFETAAKVWNDPAVDWSGYDIVVIRSTWDYFKLYGDFSEWLNQLDKAGVRVFNDTNLVRWNSDKKYLLELRERGVAIVPTQLAAGACLREVVAGLAGQEIVVKPAVSGNAYNTVRGLAGSDEFTRGLDELPEGTYLVQPFQQEVVEEGELSLLFFDGEYSHTVIKRPAQSDYRVQFTFGGRHERIEPPAEALEGARAALAAIPADLPPVYARVDGILANGRFLLMEIELIEPYLFLEEDPASVGRLTAAIGRRTSQG